MTFGPWLIWYPALALINLLVFVAIRGRWGRSVLLLGLASLAGVAAGDRIGEATGLAVLDGRQVHYLDQVDGPHAVQVKDWTGERVPAHLVPSGIVLLAAETANARDRYLAGSLEATTPRSMTDRRRLRERFERVAKLGVEWVHEEFAEGINSVAAVVRDRGGAPVAAVHAHGPSYRFPGERSPGEIGKLLAATAERVS